MEKNQPADNRPKDKDKDFVTPELLKFAFFPNMDSVLQRIAGLAQPEQWHFGNAPGNSKFPILKKYLYNIFSRIKYESEELGFKDRIVEAKHKCAINTGLISIHGNYIYLIFEKNNRENAQPWVFRQVSDDVISQDFIEFGGKLPAPPKFLISQTPSQIYYSKKVAAINADHIISTHCERLPFKFLRTYFRGFFAQHESPLRTGADWDNFKKYIKSRECAYEYGDACNKLMHAIELAQKQAANGDANKVLIYRPKEHTIAFFLPLYLYKPQDDCDFEVGLIVDNQDGEYIARTIYQTSMAYDKIRLMGRQERKWLDPKRIKNWLDPYKEPKAEKPATPKKPIAGLLVKSNTDNDGQPCGIGVFYPVNGKKVLVGRKADSSTSDIQIPSNRYMSRQHVEITESDGKYYMQWVADVNPPRVNGKKIESKNPVLLKNGDEILLGQCAMVWKQP